MTEKCGAILDVQTRNYENTMAKIKEVQESISNFDDKVQVV